MKQKKARGEPESPPRACHGVQPTYHRASRVPTVDRDLNTPRVRDIEVGIRRQ
jgi:hypothetical protein